MSKFSSKALRVALSAVLVVGLMPSTVWAKDSQTQNADQNQAKEQPVQAAGSSGVQKDQPVEKAAEPAAKTSEKAAEPEAKNVQPETIAAAETKVNAAQDITELIVDVPQKVYAVGEGGAVLKFTAPDEGTYTFFSSAGGDTYGHLYSDEELTNQLTSDDDGGSGNNFKMTWTMSAGDTVYVKARMYSNEDGYITVCAEAYDPRTPLSEVSAYASYAAILPDGSFFAPTINVERYGSLLVAGEDYVVDGYCISTDGEYIPVGEASIIPGETYYAKLVGAGSSYRGVTYCPFDVRDCADVSLMTSGATPTALIMPGNFVAPSFEIYYSDPATGEAVYLSQGSDFVVQGYFAYEDGEYVSVNGQDFSEEATYYARVEGVYPFHESKYLRFWVQNLTDISKFNYNNCLSASILRDGTFIAPEFYLYTWGLGDGEISLTQGEHFQIDGYYENWDLTTPISPEEMDGTSYFAKLVGIGDCTGETICNFHVENALGLPGMSCGPKSKAKVLADGSLFDPGYRLEFYVESTGEWISLTQDEDFYIEGYYEDSALNTSVAESEIVAGSYYVNLVGMNGYRGNRSFEITVYDVTDIEGMYYYSNRDAYMVGGSPIPPVFYVYYDDPIIGEQVYLIQDEDFYVDGYYEFEDYELEAPVDLQDMTEGRYRAKLVGISDRCKGVCVSSFYVRDLSKLSSMSYDSTNALIMGDGPVLAPKFRVYYSNPVTEETIDLAQGVDFEVEDYYQSQWDEDPINLSDMVEGASYCAKLAGIGAYAGSSLYASFDVWNASNISGMGCGNRTACYKMPGFSPQLPTFSVYYDDPSTGDRIYMIQDVDFYVEDYYEEDDYELEAPVDLQDMTEGWYRAKLVGMSDRCKGSCESSFYVYDFSRMSSMNCDSSGALIVDGNVQAPGFRVYYYNDVIWEDVYLTQGVDYVVDGYYRSDNDEDPIDLDDMVEGETYYAKLVGIGANVSGSRFVRFDVANPFDISRMDVYCDQPGYKRLDGTLTAPKFSIEFYDSSVGRWTYLTQDEDFYVEGYYSDFGMTSPVSLASVTECYAKLVGEGDYNGSVACWTSIQDLAQLSAWNSGCRNWGKLLPGGRVVDPEVSFYYWDDSDRAVYLVEGRDFEVDYSQYYAYSYDDATGQGTYQPTNDLTQGDLYVKAVGMGQCHGDVYVCVDFENYRSLWRTSISLNRSSSMLYSPQYGDAIAYTGSPLNPSFTVRSNYDGSLLVENEDYTVSYEVDGQIVDVSQIIGSPTEAIWVRAAFEGVGDFEGFEEYMFQICPAVDVSDYEAYVSLSFGTSSIKANGSFLNQGKGFVPAVSFSGGRPGRMPKQGTHYTVEWPNGIPNAAGNYICRLVAIPGSGLVGTLDVPFKVVNSLSLIGMNGQWRDANLNARELYMDAVGAYTEDWAFYPDWNYDSVYNDTYYAKTYGLDYTTRIEPLGVYSDVYGTSGDAAIDASKVFKVIVTGLGDFYDSVAKLFRVKSPAEKFNEIYAIHVNDRYVDLGNPNYPYTPGNYVDLVMTSDGKIDLSQNDFYVFGLTYGRDYTVSETLERVSGYSNTYNLTILGLGEYEGCTRSAYVQLNQPGEDSHKGLDYYSWSILYADDITMTSIGNAYGDEVVYVLNDSALGANFEGVHAEAHSSGNGPVEGVDYVVNKTLRDNGELSVEIVPAEGSSWTGRGRIWDTIYIVDRLDVANTDLRLNGHWYSPSTSSASLVVAGSFNGASLELTPYGHGSSLVKDTDYTLSVTNAATGASASLDNLSAGTFLVTVTGMGSKWTGSRTLTLDVESVQVISLQSCDWWPEFEDFDLGDCIHSYTGQAITPRLFLEYNGKMLTEGVDYTVSYGNNVSPGKAWVKATATPDSCFAGSVSMNFDIIDQGAIGYTLGDVNNNGKVNIVDAQIAYDMAKGAYGSNYAGMTTKPTGWTADTLRAAADVNRDGYVDAADARAIQCYAMNGYFGNGNLG